MMRIYKIITWTVFSWAAVILLNGCDGQNTEIRGGINVNLADRGIDFANARANPNAIAEMPRFLLETDRIQHGTITSLNTRQVTQLDDGTINSAGELSVDNLTLTWRRNLDSPSVATFGLSQQNVWPTNDMEKERVFRENMDVVIAAAAGSASSVNQALNNRINSQTFFVIADAAASIGYLTSVGPEFIETNIPEGHVLMERDIRYTVTSTNQQLIDSGTIQGTFSLIDRWGIFALLSEEIGEDTPAQFDQIIVAHRDNPFFLFSVNDFELGTFTLTINN